jgi:hypothetical protein
MTLSRNTARYVVFSRFPLLKPQTENMTAFFRGDIVGILGL